jgi:hypothetical protein
MCEKVYNIIKMYKLEYIINYYTISTNIQMSIVWRLDESTDLD